MCHFLLGAGGLPQRRLSGGQGCEVDPGHRMPLQTRRSLGWGRTGRSWPGQRKPLPMPRVPAAPPQMPALGTVSPPQPPRSSTRATVLTPASGPARTSLPSPSLVASTPPDLCGARACPGAAPAPRAGLAVGLACPFWTSPCGEAPSSWAACPSPASCAVLRAWGQLGSHVSAGPVELPGQPPPGGFEGPRPLPPRRSHALEAALPPLEQGVDPGWHLEVASGEHPQGKSVPKAANSEFREAEVTGKREALNPLPRARLGVDGTLHAVPGALHAVPGAWCPVLHQRKLIPCQSWRVTSSKYLPE